MLLPLAILIQRFKCFDWLKSHIRPVRISQYGPLGKNDKKSCINIASGNKKYIKFLSVRT